MTTEHKNKIKLANLGKKLSESHKLKLSISHKGNKNPHTEEWNNKIRLSNIGKKRSKEAIEKNRMSHLGKKWGKHSEETKIRMSLSAMNNKNALGSKRSEEHKKKISERTKGKNNHFWRGGICIRKYSEYWTRTLRISIRERDNYTCKICGEKQGDRAFCVHHIDYDKNNCNPDNLITLCMSCHSKTNKNREFWINFFSNYIK